jgi:chemotaxis protein methyltransferase CheR
MPVRIVLALLCLPLALPAVARAAAAQSRPIRILSAGCATGEEPFSIAMTVRQNRAVLAGCDTEILAVDVSESALETAAKAVYPATGLAGLPPAYVGRYFVQGNDGYTVVPAVRGMVKFMRYDLRDGLYLGKFDIVFCCNVLLYFVAEVKEELVGKLARLVRRGGYVFLGHADGVVPPRDLFDASELPSFVRRRR